MDINSIIEHCTPEAGQVCKLEFTVTRAEDGLRGDTHNEQEVASYETIIVADNGDYLRISTVIENGPKTMIYEMIGGELSEENLHGLNSEAIVPYIETKTEQFFRN